MSFGWSVGDIVAAINLVNQIIQCVSDIDGSQANFQELQSELQALQLALTNISALADEPGQIPDIVALKFVACSCQETLQRFFEKIKPFDESLGVGSRKSKLRKAPRMVRWELLVKKDIPEFRSYLVAHVGSLNLRLNTALLKIASKSSTKSDDHHKKHQQSLDLLQNMQNSQMMTICAKINAISQQDTVPKLDSLLATAGNVWKIQSQMIDIFAKAMESLPPPDLYHTWYQPPMRLEDALGRIITIPSEYDWDILQAIIQARFKNAPGHAKVRSGEYELFLGNTGPPISAKSFTPIPGAMIIMTFIVGQYAGSDRCPRVGCKSKNFLPKPDGSRKICHECLSWFRTSASSLPKPLKPLGIDDNSKAWVKEGAHPALGGSKTNTSLYEERRSYKNISIYVTELPPTPVRFRDKYHRGYTPEPSHREPAPKSEPKPNFFISRPQGNIIHITDAETTISIDTRNSVSQSKESGTYTPGRPDLPSLEVDSLRGQDCSQQLSRRKPNPSFQNRTQSTQMGYVAGSAIFSRRLHTLAGHSGYGRSKFIQRPPRSEFARNRVGEMPYPWENDPPKNPRYTGLKDPDVWANAFIF